MVILTGKVPLIIFPGALGLFDGSHDAAKGLNTSRSVTILTYSKDDTLAGVFERCFAIADDSGAQTFDLLGQSSGGWIAQCLARHTPARVRRIVLSHSFVLQQQDAWRLRLSGAMLDMLPHRLVSALLFKRARQALLPVRKAAPDRYVLLLDQLTENLRSKDFVAELSAHQRCMWESLQSPMIDVAAPTKDIPALILESDNDPIIDRSARTALRAQWAGAEVHAFHDAGHVSALVRPDEYLGVVQRFLD